MPNPNVNCLAGKRCPKCKSYGPFDVVATAVFTVTDDGTDDQRDIEWDRNSPTYCRNCPHSAQWKDFDDPKCKEKPDDIAKAGP